jgi:hypothetical protein
MKQARWAVLAATAAVAFSGCAATTTNSTEAQPAAQATPAETTPTPPTETTAPPTPAPAEPTPSPDSPEEEKVPEPEKAPESAPESSETEAESHPEGEGFCSSHTCIPNFENGRGYPVECSDGEWSKSGGISGACSGHGGEREK